MSPEAVRTAGQAMMLMGIAGAIVLALDLVSPYASSIVVILWVAFGIALDIRAERGTRGRR